MLHSYSMMLHFRHEWYLFHRYFSFKLKPIQIYSPLTVHNDSQAVYSLRNIPDMIGKSPTDFMAWAWLLNSRPLKSIFQRNISYGECFADLF